MIQVFLSFERRPVPNFLGHIFFQPATVQDGHGGGFP